ncbi:MAG TPA: glycoside hydrolase family 3 C-terminal domain-containing protein, partial [Longimicrobiales bacterium]
RAIDTVIEAVESARISMERIDGSVRRILAAKASAGLPQRQFVDLEAVDDNVGIRAHQQLARTIAERSITLARDERNLVPLPASARRILSIAYVGIQDPVAGGAFNSELRTAGREVMSRRIDQRSGATEFADLTTRADSADIVIISMYVSPVEYSGPMQTANAFAQFVEQLAVSGKPLIVVSMGSPYVVSSFPSIGTYALAWGGAPVSQTAVARALLGLAPITGKMPVSIPPLFVRSQGLSRN